MILQPVGRKHWETCFAAIDGPLLIALGLRCSGVARFSAGNDKHH
jgi:hypothetical protein